MNKEYKLLTPGPLTTTKTVKEQMLFDHCTWDEEYKQITQRIRKKLLKLAHVKDLDYTTILMQGSGSFGVESVLSSVLSDENTVLILANGAYGERMVEMAQANKINVLLYESPVNEQPDIKEVELLLKDHPEITHLAMVHSETTTGMLNNLEPFATLCKKNNLVFIVDAMSSFGGVNIEVDKLGIDYLISSANKCIQGVPGFSFIIAKLESLKKSQGNARTVSLDIHKQWEAMDIDGKWRFTSPTHVVLAFEQALKEMEQEGGIPARYARYKKNMNLLVQAFDKIGLKHYLSEENQSPIIATFEYPEGDFKFEEMYGFVKERGYAIYPGKLMGMNTFRIGVIGEIYPEDIEKLSEIMQEYFEK
ncbi:MAG: 2-aminoethylphosphonate--pyruvate transaminase [Streptococcaceae bacterium]|nr:2-aminoethylphosphonate--pyruvate transaminase [Streptococcaceae bacterium]MCL2681063.1 2-aminoethylphosphonate--pyruvate transaminase [Streptococcaceae bacterium]